MIRMECMHVNLATREIMQIYGFGSCEWLVVGRISQHTHSVLSHFESRYGRSVYPKMDVYVCCVDVYECQSSRTHINNSYITANPILQSRLPEILVCTDKRCVHRYGSRKK